MSEIRLPPGIERLAAHRAKLEALALAARDDPDLLGMAIKGSFARNIADEFSDLDLSFVVRDDKLEEALGRRMQLVQAPAPPVAAFTGEHVGLPELLIVLYDDLVHVDFLYGTLSDFPPEDQLPCRIIWERDELLSDRLATAPSPSPRVEGAWFEARMWTWVWYTQAKILRGEVYEALDALQFMRSRVLFPLLAVTRGTRPGGSRRVEQPVDELVDDFEVTVASPTRPAAMDALERTVDLYLRLVDPVLERQGVPKAEDARRVALTALRQGLEFKP